MRTAAILSATLFPKVYHFERIQSADAIILRSDRVVDNHSRPHRCAIRPFSGKRSYLGLRLTRDNLPTDVCRVSPQAHWRKRFIDEVRNSYRNLPFAAQAQGLVTEFLDSVPEKSDWLVDYLMSSLFTTLEMVGWGDKEIIRGDSLQAARYRNETEYLLNLCLEVDADVLIIGANEWRQVNQRIFNENGVALKVQDYVSKNPNTPTLDSILDLIARHGTDNICDLL